MHIMAMAVAGRDTHTLAGVMFQCCTRRQAAHILHSVPSLVPLVKALLSPG